MGIRRRARLLICRWWSPRSALPKTNHCQSFLSLFWNGLKSSILYLSSHPLIFLLNVSEGIREHWTRATNALHERNEGFKETICMNGILVCICIKHLDQSSKSTGIPEHAVTRNIRLVCSGSVKACSAYPRWSDPSYESPGLDIVSHLMYFTDLPNWFLKLRDQRSRLSRKQRNKLD